MKSSAPTSEQQQQQPPGLSASESARRVARAASTSNTSRRPFKIGAEGQHVILAHRDFFNDFTDDFNMKDLE